MFQNCSYHQAALIIICNNHAAGADLPVMGLEQAVHRLEKSSPKHSAQ